MARPKSSETAYSRESETSARFKDLANRDDLSLEEAKEGLQEYSKEFDRLLADVKLLTSVGDRLQRKLKSANMMLRQQSDEIKQINDDLQEANTELKITIDELTRTRAGRKAQTFILSIAIGLFIVSEILEGIFDDALGDSFMGQVVSWGLKIGLVLIIKPLEGYIEQRLVRSAMDDKKRQLLEKHMKTEEGGEEGAEGESPETSETPPSGNSAAAKTKERQREASAPSSSN